MIHKLQWKTIPTSRTLSKALSFDPPNDINSSLSSPLSQQDSKSKVRMGMKFIKNEK